MVFIDFTFKCIDRLLLCFQLERGFWIQFVDKVSDKDLESKAIKICFGFLAHLVEKLSDTFEFKAFTAKALWSV